MVDTLIMLYESTETEFKTNGIGGLPDALTCTVKEERNGEFELTMTYPINGKRYSDINLRRIIFAKPNPYDNPQPFRIYGISKPLNGIVTVNAEHISYDLSGYPVSPFTAINVMDAFNKLKEKSVSTFTCPFTFSTDKTTEANMVVEKPTSIRSLLGGSEGSILDTYGGGEYTFDKFNVKLSQHRGANNGVSIRYGKNLTDINQEENCSSVYTGVYPYWYSKDTGVAELTERVVYAEGTYNFSRILPLDLSSEFDEMPSEAMLKAEAKRYMEDNDIGVPKVSIDVSFVQLAQSKEYEQITLLEKVKLCDTVNVEFPELNVSATAKCISTEYDVLTDKYTQLSLGDAKSNLAATIASQPQAATKQIEEATSALTKAINNATSLITGGQGGYVILHSSTEGSKYPDEILIMDKPDIKTATKVWRWNKKGLGYSSNGINGPFPLAMTMDGAIVADRITTGTLSANRIAGGTFAEEITANKFNIKGGSIAINTSENSNDVIKLNSYSASYNTTWSSTLRPLGVELVNTGDHGNPAKRMLCALQAGGLYLYVGTDDTKYTSVTSTGARFNGTTSTYGWAYVRDDEGNATAYITQDGHGYFTVDTGNGLIATQQAVVARREMYISPSSNSNFLSIFIDGDYKGNIPIVSADNDNITLSISGGYLMLNQRGKNIGSIKIDNIY